MASYPEFATPNLDPNARFPLTPFERWYGTNIIGGNIQGRFSEYNGDFDLHRDMHNLWRFGQRGSYSSIATHGPWTPAWNVAFIPSDPRSMNDNPKP